jgi:uncharacterized protein (TIGR03503 family)
MAQVVSLKIIKFIKTYLFICVVSYSPILLAETDILKITPVKKRPLNIQYYKNDHISNQIPYLDNRFRIDENIEEITMLFYRSSGSQPIILVRPDGTKIRVNNTNLEQFNHVEWFDGSSFDLIKITKPMPGPWQAVGQILPDSKIMIVSEISLVVEPIPEIVLMGETLKIEAKIFNNKEAIENNRFRKVVELNVDFYSSNNPAFDNFGADTVRLTSFRDDGQYLDEFSGDNIFTGEFEMDFAPGEWQPVYSIKLPIVTREVRQKKITVQKSPITLTVDKTEEEGKFHKLHFNIDKTFVDVDSLIFQGKITYPDKQSKPFFIKDGRGEQRTIDVEHTETGLYKVKASAFGKTIKGREFRLVVAQYSFHVDAFQNEVDLALVEGRVAEGLSEEAIAAERAALRRLQAAEALALKLEKQRVAFEEKEATKKKEMLITITIVNSIIIIIALISFIIYRRRNSEG